MGLLDRLEQVIDILGEGLQEDMRQRRERQGPQRIAVEDGSDGDAAPLPASEEQSVAPGALEGPTPVELAPVVPEGMMLVPLSAWEQVLLQLGNLHEAGRDLAESRERAARAEERYAFELERRKERDERIQALEAELELMRAGPAPEAPRPEPTAATVTTPPTDPPPSRQIANGFRRLFRRS